MPKRVEYMDIFNRIMDSEDEATKVKIVNQFKSNVILIAIAAAHDPRVNFNDKIVEADLPDYAPGSQGHMQDFGYSITMLPLFQQKVSRISPIYQTLIRVLELSNEHEALFYLDLIFGRVDFGFSQQTLHDNWPTWFIKPTEEVVKNIVDKSDDMTKLQRTSMEKYVDPAFVKKQDDADMMARMKIRDAKEMEAEKLALLEAAAKDVEDEKPEDDTPEDEKLPAKKEVAETKKKKTNNKKKTNKPKK